jgi:hypothetical protein
MGRALVARLRVRTDLNSAFDSDAMRFVLCVVRFASRGLATDLDHASTAAAR